MDITETPQAFFVAGCPNVYVNTHRLSVMAKCKAARINRLIRLNKIKPDALGKWGTKVIPLWEEENAWSIAHQIQTIRELREEFAL